MTEKTALVTTKSPAPADSEKAPVTASENTTPTDREGVQGELEHRTRLLQIYKARLRTLEEQAAAMGSAYLPPAVIMDLKETRENIDNLEKDISSLQKAEVAVTEGKSIAKQEENKDLLFMPEWSVLRSKVQYVDASLAYKFADASADANVLMSFTTLFLGAFISFAVSAVLSIDTHNAFSMTLLWTATVFSLVATVIFGYLSKRADDRAREVKKQLFPVNEFKQP